MAEKTTREILDDINSGVTKVNARIDEIEKRSDLGSDEGKDEIRAIVSEIMEAQKAARKNIAPQRAPIDTVADKAAAIAADQTGGLFAKKYRMPYNKLIKDIGAMHPVISKTSDRDQLMELGEAHDSVHCVKGYISTKFKNDTEAERFERFVKHADVQRYAHLCKLAGYHEKADEIMNPGASGQSSLDFTFLSSNLVDRVGTEYEIANLFFHFTMTRASQEINIPTNEAICLLGGGGTTPPLTTYPSGGITPTPPLTYMQQLNFEKTLFTAKHALVFLPFDDDMVEDSIIPWMPYVMNQAVVGLARGADRACLDGDAVGAHMDHHANDPVVTPDYRVAYNGLRAMSLTNQGVDASGAVTTALLDTAREALGVFARRVSLLRIITGYTQWFKMIKLAEFQKLNEVGSLAQAVHGEFGNFRGIPVVLSDFIREDLNASGVYDDSVTTKSVIHVVRPDRFWFGTFNGVETETTRIAPQLMTLVQTDVRRAFMPVDKQLITSAPAFDAGDAPCSTIYDLS